MKKVLIASLFLFSFFLTACEKTVVIEEITCTDQQIEEAGICVDLTGQEIQLRTVLENTVELTNYQLNITISGGEEELTILMMFDGNKVAIETLNQTDYYEDNSGVCRHTIMMNGYLTADSLDCFSSTDYLFYKGFEYNDFQVIDGKYQLNPENYQIVEGFFQKAFPDSTITSFKMAATDTYVSEMIVELLVDDETYLIQMNFSEVDNVRVVIPQEEGE